MKFYLTDIAVPEATCDLNRFRTCQDTGPGTRSSACPVPRGPVGRTPCPVSRQSPAWGGTPGTARGHARTSGDEASLEAVRSGPGGGASGRSWGVKETTEGPDTFWGGLAEYLTRQGKHTHNGLMENSSFYDHASPGGQNRPGMSLPIQPFLFFRKGNGHTLQKLGPSGVAREGASPELAGPSFHVTLGKDCARGQVVLALPSKGQPLSPVGAGRRVGLTAPTPTDCRSRGPRKTTAARVQVGVCRPRTESGYLPPCTGRSPSTGREIPGVCVQRPLWACWPVLSRCLQTARAPGRDSRNRLWHLAQKRVGLERCGKLLTQTGVQTSRSRGCGGGGQLETQPGRPRTSWAGAGAARCPLCSP